MHGGHHHHHGHHDHAPATLGVTPFAIALTVNLVFVVIEVAAGLHSGSTALLADAGHNLSDVMALALAAFAAWLAKRPPAGRRTYGFGKAGVLAALANALLLMLASGVIGWEALNRLREPAPVAADWIMAVAGAGIVINAGAALLFAHAHRSDLNARGAFLHLLADAAVSAGVIVAGLAIALTGWVWIDSAVAFVVLSIIVVSAFSLLQEALDLALDAAPASIDLVQVRARLEGFDGIASVHDLHVWAMSGSETALTAHLIRPGGGDDVFLKEAARMLHAEFGIGHVTLQIESGRLSLCTDSHA
jgi:cobalt-zinc-cadmium efflux system protein